MRKFINEYKFYIFAFAAIFFLIFITYRHADKFEFIGLDDTTIIANKVSEMDSVSKLKNFLTQPVFDEADSLFYRPFLNLSFAIDSIISGGELGFYHFSNAMIHTAAVFTLLIFLLLLNYSKTLSLTLSLIFAVEPIIVSAIAWIPGRNDSLLAIFVFLSLIFFIKTVQTGKILHGVFASIFLLSAFLTKETAIIIPPVFLLYLFCYGKPDKKNLLTAFIVSAIPFFAYILLRTYTLSQGSGNLDLAKAALNLFHSLAAYLWYLKTVFFLEKIYLYPNNLPITIHSVSAGLIPLIFFASAAYIFRKKANFKHIIFGLLWYILFLAPTIVARTGTYFNHRLYLPIVGIFIIVAEIAVIAPLNSGLKIKKILFALGAATIVLFALASYKYSFYYKDASSFWFNAYRQNPLSSTAAIEVSARYSAAGDLENAEKYLLTALDMDKNRPKTIMLILAGNFYFDKKDDAKAFEYYAKAEERNKYNEYIYVGLSRHYEMLRDKERALKELERGLAIIPKSKLIAKRIKILKGEIHDDSYVVTMKAN
ncbi:MAG: glycosyltransferase family 39 protein [Endomicrobium sp.]|jgi:tetratricopeptide (TPR) repeat protein|nr:glycosyltransferase family 39 protein [Endomicrobium sp.]